MISCERFLKGKRASPTRGGVATLFSHKMSVLELLFCSGSRDTKILDLIIACSERKIDELYDLEEYTMRPGHIPVARSPGRPVILFFDPRVTLGYYFIGEQ